MLSKKNFEYEKFIDCINCTTCLLFLILLYTVLEFFLLMYSCKYAVGVHFVNILGRADIIHLGFVLLSMIFVQFRVREISPAL